MNAPLPHHFLITLYDDSRHRNGVINLWNEVFSYQEVHNAPALLIDKKLAMNDRLFFVAEAGDSIVGTVMAGYDGHRGWLYSLAVAKEARSHGVGSALVSASEDALADLGCVKVNLQIRQGNEGVQAFYHALGFTTEPNVSMGKRIQRNIG